MKKTNFIITLFLISLGCFLLIPQSVKSAYVCYPDCDASTCVNDACDFRLGFKSAAAGDTISLVHRDLKLAAKVTVGDVVVDNWSIKSDTGYSQILEFVLPNNIKTGTAFINVYDSAGAEIALGTLTIYSKTSPNITPPQPTFIEPQYYQPIQPSCITDTWSCGEWSVCSPSGIQSRSCSKTFDCPNMQTASPATDQYCDPPNKQTQQVLRDNFSNKIINQDIIIKSTVKLICPVDENKGSQGSGTVIDSNGTILTNKHVVDGTLGCFVGFINDFNDEPYFGERQIADIWKISESEDIAILKIRNPQKKSLTYIDITKGNDSRLRLGTKITIYGYPAKFGTNMTYTSGDFGGIDGIYLKVGAIIEHGNSGGGAYLEDGSFVGIPSAVIKGELNALGYVLSVNTINNWMGNSAAQRSRADNNYSRVSSILENMDLKKLGSLELVIPNKENSLNVSPDNQMQSDLSIESTQDKNLITLEKEHQSKKSWLNRFINWIVNLFK